MSKNLHGLGQGALPIDGALDRIVNSLDVYTNLILRAPPGSGKTTRVPLALLNASWLGPKQSLLMLEPRRIAARSAARFMAKSLGERVGERIGYQVRFEQRISARTRICVITEGVLIARAQRDPELAGVAGIIFDEFHERSLEADLGLALSLDVQRSLRPDLRLLVMSATLDASALGALLDDAPEIQVPGASHPLTIRYHPARHGTDPYLAAIQALPTAMSDHPGDALVFMPGAREIDQTLTRLRALPALRECALHALHSRVKPSQQDRALLPDNNARRRVVVATNIAESSLTLDGIRIVIDTGVARRVQFDPNSGLTRLKTMRISRASALQRAGRAARQGSGLCIRLWSEAEHGQRLEHDPAAIRSSDLSQLVLELKRWGVHDPEALSWLDAPPAPAYAQASDLLRRLSAIDEAGAITQLGRQMSALPVHPRLAAMLVYAMESGDLVLGCDLAAVLETPGAMWDQGHPTRDLSAAAQALERCRRGDSSPATPLPLRHASELSTQLARRISPRGRPTSNSHANVGELLLHAYPDRVAQRRDERRGEYRLVTGRGARLPSDDGLANSDWLVIPDLDAGDRVGRVHAAAPVALKELRQHLSAGFTTHDITLFDPEAGRVLARREERFGELLISRDETQPVAVPTAIALLLQEIRRRGLELLTWDQAAMQTRARIACLHTWRPQGAWPSVTDPDLLANLETWLGPRLSDVRSVQALKRLKLAPALTAMLSAKEHDLLTQLAPTHLQVPSGSRIALHYQMDAPPVLAVKLQEMFGLHRSPTVCDGEISVTLHLLSPAGRPVQVTNDLASFWHSGYAQVRRELRGRYPKHPWPEDPLNAEATRASARSRRSKQRTR